MQRWRSEHLNYSFFPPSFKRCHTKISEKCRKRLTFYMNRDLFIPHQELSSRKALELALQILHDAKCNAAIFSQVQHQKDVVERGGVFSIYLEFNLFNLFSFSSSLTSWMLNNVSASHNLYRRALFILLEKKYKLWSEQQIHIQVTFDSLPCEPPISQSKSDFLSHYFTTTCIVDSIADPFVELSVLHSSFLSYVFS